VVDLERAAAVRETPAAHAEAAALGAQPRDHALAQDRLLQAVPEAAPGHDGQHAGAGDARGVQLALEPPQRVLRPQAVQVDLAPGAAPVVARAAAPAVALVPIAGLAHDPIMPRPAADRAGLRPDPVRAGYQTSLKPLLRLKAAFGSQNVLGVERNQSW
jgi:hypothetical protein